VAQLQEEQNNGNKQDQGSPSCAICQVMSFSCNIALRLIFRSTYYLSDFKLLHTEHKSNQFSLIPQIERMRYYTPLIQTISYRAYSYPLQFDTSNGAHALLYSPREDSTVLGLKRALRSLAKPSKRHHTHFLKADGAAIDNEPVQARQVLQQLLQGLVLQRAAGHVQSG
jgi:hypothetical protein